jgi:hypothetical protein
MPVQSLNPDQVEAIAQADAHLNNVALPNYTEQCARVAAAALFFSELLDSVETLSGIADVHGARTLSDLMFLQQAILNGGFIDHYPDESNVLNCALKLPSGERWASFIKVEYMAQSLA